MISAFYGDFEEKQVKTLIKSVSSIYKTHGKLYTSTSAICSRFVGHISVPRGLYSRGYTRDFTVNVLKNGGRFWAKTAKINDFSIFLGVFGSRAPQFLSLAKCMNKSCSESSI